jgi:hypothetical protein
MKDDVRLTFLPPVLVAIVLRVFVASQMVFRADGSKVFLQEDAIGCAVVFGLPALLIFGVIRLRHARNKRLNLGLLVLSVATSFAILLMNLGEPYLRLYWNKARYDSAAAQRPEAPAVVFDWGDTPRFFVLFGHVKEYLVIARGSAAATLDRYVGHEIESWGDERAEVDELLISDWNEKDVENRFKVRRFDACRMQVSHLPGSYYYIADWC